MNPNPNPNPNPSPNPNATPNQVAQRQRHARQWFTRYQKSIFQHTLDTTLKQRDDARLEGSGGNHSELGSNSRELTLWRESPQ